MADGRHFENRYIAISQWKIIRFWWNFVHSNRFWTGWTSRDQKWKSCIGQSPSSTERISCYYKSCLNRYNRLPRSNTVIYGHVNRSYLLTGSMRTSFSGCLLDNDKAATSDLREHSLCVCNAMRRVCVSKSTCAMHTYIPTQSTCCRVNMQARTMSCLLLE